MNLKKVLETLIPEFQKNKIDFALIGGHALYFASVARTTLDIDFMVLLEQSDIINDIMKKYEYTLNYKTNDVANYTSLFVELGQIDFLFAHRKYALKMLKRAEYKQIFNLNIKVIKSEDIIGLKIQSSSNDPQRFHKDMADIEEIIRENIKNLDLELVKEYFSLFNRESELNEILEKTK